MLLVIFVEYKQNGYWNFLRLHSVPHTPRYGPIFYRGADKSLARPGRKQARKHVRDTRDFNDIETRAFIKFFFFPARHGAEGNSRLSDKH